MATAATVFCKSNVTLFLPLVSNLDHVIGLEGCHSARHWLHSGQPHLQARQRCAHAGLLHGGERLPAQVGDEQCQHAHTRVHEVRVIATAETLTVFSVTTDTASPGCPLTVNMSVCVWGKKHLKKTIKKKKETGTSSLNCAAGR